MKKDNVLPVAAAVAALLTRQPPPVSKRKPLTSNQIYLAVREAGIKHDIKMLNKRKKRKAKQNGSG